MNRVEPTSQPEKTESIPRLLRLPAVLQVTGLARSTVYRMVAEHTFPAPVRLAKRAVGWRHDDVRQWTIGRPSTSR
jgi:prophage regulatory protein